MEELARKNILNITPYIAGKPIEEIKRQLGLKEIIKLSSKVTHSGGIVLLSPASTSFDMFKDYSDRGYQFKEAVKALT